MEFNKDLPRKAIKTIRSWSTQKKLLVLIVVWALIFIPSIVSYTNVHREKKFAFFQKRLHPLIQGRETGTWLHLLKASM